ncbi:MAG: hypothetical protein H6855_05610 [Rhodospirillales bacterium]|nr:hypothetical protein [Rhodospirillales bacterium]MCB9965538.1 hypothetical protein [Rhodospirillales bacterium]
MIAQIQSDVDTNLEARGKVFVVNPSENQPEAIDRIYNNYSGTNPFLDTEAGQEILAGRMDNPAIGMNIKYGDNLRNEGYIAFSYTAQPAETVNEAMHFFSRATKYGADFEGRLSPEFTQTFTAVHETVEAVRGRAVAGDQQHYRYQEMDTMLENRVSDATAALYWIKNGGDLEQVNVMAEGRDLRMGYAPTKIQDVVDESGNKKSYVQLTNLTHDTGDVLRAITKSVEDGTLRREDLQGMSLSELAKFAEEKFAQPSMPTERVFMDMKVAVSNIAIKNGETDNAVWTLEDPPPHAPHISLGDSYVPAFTNSPETDIERKMIARFEAAHADIMGESAGITVYGPENNEYVTLSEQPSLRNPTKDMENRISRTEITGSTPGFSSGMGL